jgi:hypothetical protein
MKRSLGSLSHRISPTVFRGYVEKAFMDARASYLDIYNCTSLQLSEYSATKWHIKKLIEVWKGALELVSLYH